MKTRNKTRHSGSRHEAKNLTLGDLIASTYAACGESAPKILQLAIDSQVIRFAQSSVH